jgi:hypothetical protein
MLFDLFGSEDPMPLGALGGVRHAAAVATQGHAREFRLRCSHYLSTTFLT